MNAAKTRFPKVSLEELAKVLPKEVLDGNENHRGNQKDKKRNKQQVAKTNKPKSTARKKTRNAAIAARTPVNSDARIPTTKVGSCIR